jgi:hypothetical protein
VHGRPATLQQLLADSRARLTQTPTVVALDTSRTPVFRIPEVGEAECVGCNLCWLGVRWKTASPIIASMPVDRRKVGRSGHAGA